MIFKAVVKQFTIQVNKVQLEIDSDIKDQQIQATKLFETIKLQSAIVFGLDNKPITSIESMSRVVISSNLFITLNFTCKQKCKVKNRPSSNTILLSETFKKLIIVLAQALVKVKELSLLPATNTLSTSDNSTTDIKKND